MTLPLKGCGHASGRNANALALYNAVKCFYSCEDAAGANFTDASGNAQTLTQANSPGSTTGLVANCRTFTRASSMNASRTSEATIQVGDNDFCAMIWTYFATANAFQGIFGKYDGGGNSEWALYQGNTGTLQPRFGVSVDGTNIDATSQIDLGEVATGGWHLLAVWHTASDNKLRGSIDAGSVTTGSAYVGSLTARSAPLVMASLTAAGNYLDGRLDQVYYGSTALTQAYIDWFYNAGSGRTWNEIATS